MLIFADSRRKMSFLNPYMLWGLLAVAVPVIIHLFNFRRFRRVYFTNVRFLEELQQQTRRQSQLRHILVMILRMLTIAALVISFAQPFIPSDESGSRPGMVNHVSVYIDNSFSMEALGTGGALLEVAKEKAREIASSYHSSDLFALLTNDFEGRHQRWLSQEEFFQMLDETVISPGTRTFSEVAGRQRDLLLTSGKGNMVSYLISDFQASICDFENISGDSLVSTWLVPLNSVGKENLFIDSCWFASPVHQSGQGVKLLVRVTNQSATDFEKVPLKLLINGQQKAVASMDLPRGAGREVELPFTNHESGIQYGTLEITDFPVTFDDRLFLVFDVAGKIPVLSINGNGESKYLDALFGNDSSFRLVNNAYSNIDYNRLPGFSLIILNELKEISSGLSQELSSYLENGGSVVIIPADGLDPESYRQFLDAFGANHYTELVREATRVTEIDRDNPVFEGVFEKTLPSDQAKWDNTDWPVVSAYYRLSRSTRSSQTGIMTMLNGQYFMTREQAGHGKLYLLAVPLADSYSNFASHAIFVPAMYRIALLSAATEPLYYTLGRDNVIELYNTVLPGDQTIKMVSADGGTELIPGHKSLDRKLELRIGNQITKAGHYTLTTGQDTLRGIALNYNRLESIMQFSDQALLQEQIDRYLPGRSGILSDKGKPISEAIKDMNRGTTLWKLFIILALVFLGIEIIILRFWK
jgi:hypothetical protein